LRRTWPNGSPKTGPAAAVGANLGRMLFVAIAAVSGLVVFDLLDLLNRPRTG
jgi:hypothetical protein